MRSASCGTDTKIVSPSTPIPLRPASSHDCGLVAAIQMRGCGFWTGLGITLRSGMSK